MRPVFKLKCPRCKQVKRTLKWGTRLLKHRLTRLCPDCGTEMYHFQSGGIRMASQHPNYFTQVPPEQRVPGYLPSLKKSRKGK